MRKIFLCLFCLLTAASLISCSGGGGGDGGGSGGGTATLQWTTPTTDIDGATITITGYKIYYGTESGNYSSVIDVPGGNVSTYTVSGLSAGYTYYFVVTAYYASGVESDPTDEQSKTL